MTDLGLMKIIRGTSLGEDHGLFFFWGGKDKENFLCRYLTTTFLPLMMLTPFCGTRRVCPLVL